MKGGRGHILMEGEGGEGENRRVRRGEGEGGHKKGGGEGISKS